jgi:hypothetical protein
MSNVTPLSFRSLLGLAFSLLLTLASVLPACHNATQSALQPAPLSHTAKPGVQTAQLPAALSQPFSAEMEALLLERERLASAEGTFGRTKQTAPQGFTPLRKLGVFPKVTVARAAIVALTGTDRQSSCPSSEDEPLAANGTFCSDARIPGFDLSAAELTEVLAMVPESMQKPKDGHVTKRGSARCAFDPHHALVFYNSKGTPVATIVVCLSCGEWIVAPGSEASGGTKPSVMSNEERATLVRIASAHGLAPWRFDEHDKTREQLRAYLDARYGTEMEPTAEGVARRAKRLALGPGLDRSKPLRDLGDAERMKLCQWIRAEVRPARGVRSQVSLTGFERDHWLETLPLVDVAVLKGVEGYGYICQQNGDWTASYTDEGCAKNTLSCASSVASLETCLVSFREPDDICKPRPECEALMGCLPWIQRAKSGDR